MLTSCERCCQPRQGGGGFGEVAGGAVVIFQESHRPLHEGARPDGRPVVWQEGGAGESRRQSERWGRRRCGSPCFIDKDVTAHGSICHQGAGGGWGG